MAKNMPVPSTRTLNVTKTIGIQSIILSISRLLFDTIYREENYLKTSLQQLHFLFKPSSNLTPIITFPSHGIRACAWSERQIHLALVCPRFGWLRRFSTVLIFRNSFYFSIREICYIELT